MENRRPWFLQPWARVIIGLIALIVLGGGASAVVLSQSAAPEQPIEFPHNFHVGLGLECRFCHPGVDWGPVAGLPPTDKCWGCHQQIERRTGELAKLVVYGESNQQIPWVPVAIQPDFVQFNHAGHIQAGFTCENCHGNVAQMTVAEPQRGQNMGWCLDCHRNSRPDEWARLSDCSLCHY